MVHSPGWGMAGSLSGAHHESRVDLEAVQSEQPDPFMCRLTFTLLIAALVLFAASLLYTEAAGTQIRNTR